MSLHDPVFLTLLRPAGPTFTVAIAEASGVLTATVTTLSAAGTPAYSFDWRRGGVTLGAADAATYDTAGVNGLYTVEVTGTDDAGIRFVNSNTILIGEVPAVPVNAVTLDGTPETALTIDGTDETIITVGEP
jgi:hypothetical protein